MSAAKDYPTLAEAAKIWARIAALSFGGTWAVPVISVVNFSISAWAVAAANIMLTASATTTPEFWIRIMVNVSCKTGAVLPVCATFRRSSGSDPTGLQAG